MQGIFILTGIPQRRERCRTKKDLKATVAAHPQQVVLEGTFVMGTDYDGLLVKAPAGTYTVVGPDPYTSRKWYATVQVIEHAGCREYKVI